MQGKDTLKETRAACWGPGGQFGIESMGCWGAVAGGFGWGEGLGNLHRQRQGRERMREEKHSGEQQCV